MGAILGRKWGGIRGSFWFLPLLQTITIAAIAVVTLRFDRNIWEFSADSRWVFGGGPEAARTVLSVIAGSLITVVSVAFSITIIAVQQAATQYSPRVLRRFLEDRTNQWVLGTYIATFISALLVLREVRDDTPDIAGFVPAVSVTFIMVLAIVSIGMLVYFIHHIVQSIQISTMLMGIRQEFKKELNLRFSDEVDSGDSRAIGAARDTAEVDLLPGRRELRIEAQKEGYVRSIEVRQLITATRGSGIHVVIATRSVGDYLFPGMVMFRIHSEGELEPERTKSIRNAVLVSSSRSVRQDLLFAVRQITDIAIKALSPGINDPTSAEECITHLGGMIADLIARRFPPARETLESRMYVFKRPDFDDYVRASFSQIRQVARGKAHVLKTLIGTLAELALLAKSSARLTPLRQEVEYAMSELESSGMTDFDQRELQRLCQSEIQKIRHLAEDLRKAA